MRSLVRTLASVAVALALPACSGETTTLDGPSAAMDAGADAQPDAAPDAASDVAPDAPATDAGLDGTASDADVGPDTGPDTGSDAAPDASPLDPVGAACSDGDSCEGALCLTASMGFPDGYCTATGCALDAASTSCLPFGGDGLCLQAGQGGVALCLDRCDPHQADCRAHYVCQTIAAGTSVCLPEPVCGNGKVEVGEECEPPETPTCNASCQGMGDLPVGDPCSDAAQCAGNYCIGQWPDGYCTQYDCDLADPESSCAPAGGDGYCWDIGESGTPFGVCLDRCQPGAGDCRAGYLCVPVAGGMGLCIPEPVCGNGTVEAGEECEPPDTATCDSHCQGLGALPVGDPCATAADCAGNYCIDAWPSGYCSFYGCDILDPDASCESAGGDGHCIDVGDAGTPLGLCLDRCDPATPDCRAGYTCQSFPGSFSLCLPTPVCGNGVVEAGEECEPPNTSSCDAQCKGPGSLAVGQACQSAGDCAGNLCVTEWPDGYCSDLGCDLANQMSSCASAGGDGICVDVGDSGSPVGICLDRCVPLASDCRDGYECVRIALTMGLCLATPVCGNGVVERGEECEPPNAGSCDAGCQGPGAAPVGEPCTAPTECAGNLCLKEADGWTGGYCSQGDCDPFSSASCEAFGPDAVCGVLDVFGAMRVVCLDGCSSSDDCRPGYQCQWVGIGGNGCVPQ